MRSRLAILTVLHKSELEGMGFNIDTWIRDLELDKQRYNALTLSLKRPKEKANNKKRHQTLHNDIQQPQRPANTTSLRKMGKQTILQSMQIPTLQTPSSKKLS